jgi:hypothetical protein
MAQVHVLFMNFAHPSTPPAPTTPTDPCRERTERHLRMLEELAEIGMDLARAVRQRALGAAAAEPADDIQGIGGDLGLVFSRVARAVRQTLALEARIEDDRRMREDRAAAAEIRRVSAIEWDHKDRRRTLVTRAVEQMIETEAETDENRAEDLLADLDERLEDGELDADLAQHPISEIIARICRDLGITPDWSLWANEPWAIEEAETAAPGSPFAAGSRPVPPSDPAKPQLQNPDGAAPPRQKPP